MTEETNPVAEAEAAKAAAEEHLAKLKEWEPTGKQALKDAKAAVKVCKGNVAAAEKALAELPEDGDAEAAQAAVTEANEALEAAMATEAQAKTNVDEGKERMKEARKAITEANKAIKEAKKKDSFANRPMQNGYRLPAPNSKNGQAFQAIDDVREVLGRMPRMHEVLPLAEQRGLALGNVRGKYNRYRQYHGIERQGSKVERDAIAKLAEAFPGAYDDVLKSLDEKAKLAEAKAAEAAAKAAAKAAEAEAAAAEAEAAEAEA